MHNVFHIRLSLFLKQLDMNEEDILRITYELLSRRSFILETVLSFIYRSTILLILFTNICLSSSYPGQCIRKCSSFSILPDLQTVQNLSDVGLFVCLPLFIISKWHRHLFHSKHINHSFQINSLLKMICDRF